MARLQRDFFARDTVDVAQDLLGKNLVHRVSSKVTLRGRIVETEAYLGLEDPACHSFNNRRTPRTEVMFGAPGLAYVYFIYGMHFCFNVVTHAEEVPEAVLVRALALDEITALYLQPRFPDRAKHRLANGPGKLCSALSIDKRFNGLDLTTSNALYLEDDGASLNGKIVDGPRVGIGHLHDAVHWPLRFAFANEACVSSPALRDESS